MPELRCVLRALLLPFMTGSVGLLSLSGSAACADASVPLKSITRPPESVATACTADPPPKPGPALPIAGSRSKFAIIDLDAAASAGPLGYSYTGSVTVQAIVSGCEPVSFSASRHSIGAPSIGEEPSVAVTHYSICVPVSAQEPPLELVGRRVAMRRVPLMGEFLNGEEFSSADPDELQAAAATIFIPGSRGGHQVGVFALAGILELPDGMIQQFVTATSGAALFIDAPLSDQRLLMSLRSPIGTPVNIMLRAPVDQNEEPVAPPPAAEADADPAAQDGTPAAAEAGEAVSEEPAALSPSGVLSRPESKSAAPL